MSNSRELHYRYGLLLLVIALIESVAFGLYTVTNLVEKMEFALTITSLVVGVVAIVYTFLTANKQDLQLAQLLTTNSNISAASAQIQQAGAALVDHIESLPPRFDKIEQSIASLGAGVLSVPTSPKIAREPKEPDKEDVVRFITELNYGAMASLYFGVRAFQEKLPITRDLVGKAERFPPFSFVFGLLCGASGASLLEMEFKDKAIRIQKISPALLENLVSQLRSIVSVMKEEEGEETPILETLMSRVDKVFS